MPADFVIIQRINLGLYAILGQLRATADYRKVAEELWPMVDGPPSTPMGEAEAAWLAARGPARPEAPGRGVGRSTGEPSRPTPAAVTVKMAATRPHSGL